MRNSPLLLVSLIFLSIAVAACDPATESTGAVAQNQAAQDEWRDDGSTRDESGTDDEPLDDAELMRRAAIEAGLPVSDVVVPEISARTYTSGRIEVQVSGFFAIDASPELDRIASISDGGYTWIQYGTSGGPAPNATVTIGNGDIGISVAVGSYLATGTSTECTITTDVTPTRVAGHYSCPTVTGYNHSDRTMGDVKIEIDFEANS